MTWKCIWRKCATEFLHAEKTAPIDIYQYFLNLYGDQTVSVSTVRQWVVRFSWGDNGSPPLVKIVIRMAFRFLFIPGENVYLTIVTMLKNSFLMWRICSNSVIRLFVSFVVSMEINRRHYFWSDLHIILSLPGWMILRMVLQKNQKIEISLFVIWKESYSLIGNLYTWISHTCAINCIIFTKIFRGISLGTTPRDPLGKSVVTIVISRL